MHRIKCPWCGYRDESEFQYKGDATKIRPKDNASEAKFFDYVYTRKNPRGWHTEWWQHVGGCRQWVKVVRNTATHEILECGGPQDKLTVPKTKKGAK
ncbi:MAG: sarcosine oxidase subunit delta [Pseudomonadota bacterium]